MKVFHTRVILPVTSHNLLKNGRYHPHTPPSQTSSDFSSYTPSPPLNSVSFRSPTGSTVLTNSSILCNSPHAAPGVAKRTSTTHTQPLIFSPILAHKSP
ncbi:hypothetical protein GEMRC1_014055 [Eukaryota sp. GEM-RC1]